MQAFNAILDKARTQPAGIALPESGDTRILHAAVKAHDMGIAQPILLGKTSQIQQLANEESIDVSQLQVIDIEESSAAQQRYAQALFEKRQHKGMTPEKATQAIRDPLTLANLMVHLKEADGCVAGAQYATADVVRSALQIVGGHPQYPFVSSFFIMLLCKPFHHLKGSMIFADCGLVIDPDAEQLSWIAAAAGDSGKQLLDIDPCIAMLSFSTNRSANHPMVDKVVDAAERLKVLRPEWPVLGDVQLDAALIPEILQKKAPEMAQEKEANTFIFPSIEAGNIGYKMCERFAQADAIGPILQGLKRPVNDLSRGCSTDDVVNVMAVTSVQAQAC